MVGVLWQAGVGFEAFVSPHSAVSFSFWGHLRSHSLMLMLMLQHAPPASHLFPLHETLTDPATARPRGSLCRRTQPDIH